MPVRQPTRVRSVQNLRQRMILETEAFLNQRLGRLAPKRASAPDTITPAEVQAARDMPEPLFVVIVSPWTEGPATTDLLIVGPRGDSLPGANGDRSASPLPSLRHLRLIEQRFSQAGCPAKLSHAGPPPLSPGMSSVH